MVTQNQHQDCSTVAASGDNDADKHIFITINLGNGDATATASPGRNTLQAWEHRPNGNTVAAQWWQVFTTAAIASWQ